jgi:hypothetical protein
MSVKAAADTGMGAVDPVGTTDRERQRSAQFSHGESATGVAALRDVDELDERRRGHIIS